MKRLIWMPAVILSFGMALNAHAVCETASRVVDPSLSALMSGSLVCGRPATGYTGPATDRWQEEHLAGGDLYDFKQGPGHPVDPRERVGSWTVGADLVSYTYGGSGPFSYAVHTVDATSGIYSFCDGSTEVVRARIGPNTGGGCGGSFPP